MGSLRNGGGCGWGPRGRLVLLRRPRGSANRQCLRDACRGNVREIKYRGPSCPTGGRGASALAAAVSAAVVGQPPSRMHQYIPIDKSSAGSGWGGAGKGFPIAIRRHHRIHLVFRTGGRAMPPVPNTRCKRWHRPAQVLASLRVYCMHRNRYAA